MLFIHHRRSCDEIVMVISFRFRRWLRLKSVESAASIFILIQGLSLFYSDRMPASAVIMPALPLNSVPPSPRSDVSAATERSRDTDKSFDKVMAGITKTSTSRFVRPEVVFFDYIFNNRFHGCQTPVVRSQRVGGGTKGMVFEFHRN
jgi:hypothetical protein